MSLKFENLGLLPQLIRGLSQEKIVAPTEIQSKVIPLALEGRDIIGRSATGTGKTLAYLLPIFQKIEVPKKETQVIIFSPSHELAMQIHRETELLSKNSGIALTSLPIIGNANVARQIEKLKAKPHIITGSIGRIKELIHKKKINMGGIRIIVIDEADRMLDDRDYISLQVVLKMTLKERQMMLFSATLPQWAIDKAKTITNHPEVIQIKDNLSVAKGITHWYFYAEPRNKLDTIRKVVRSLNIERALVFLNQGDAIDYVVEKLNKMGLKSAGLHSGLEKMTRKKAIENFRDKKIVLLLATDIAARGLDIADVDYIFNLEMPVDPGVYLHRAGRTARAGKSGTVISMVHGREADLVLKHEKDLKIKILPKNIAGGKIY